VNGGGMTASEVTLSVLTFIWIVFKVARFVWRRI
jgi:hypothetical protein